MLTKEKKKELSEKFGKHTRDTGGASAQIALITARINDLVPHFESKSKDHTSRRGLLQMVGKRRRLLTYLRRTDPKRYVQILRELKLRR